MFVVLISVLAVTAFARRESKPLRDMAKAANDFAHGNLEARVRVEEDYSEEVEELALAFNNMASSLPNENIVSALEEMGKAVYPEVFGK